MGQSIPKLSECCCDNRSKTKNTNVYVDKLVNVIIKCIFLI